jgi:hypothetical protein
MRLQRRGLVRGYVRVPEVGADSGMLHLHVLFRGSYIDQAYLSAQWQEIHNAPVVDIRKRRNETASYMAKYMSKEGAGQYSWSWGWVWQGFCRDWQTYKRYWWAKIYVEGKNDLSNLLVGWRMCLHGQLRFDFEAMQDFLPTNICIQRGGSK